MKKQLYTLFIFLVAAVSAGKAQQTHLPTIRFENQSVENRNGNLSVRIDINIGDTRIAITQMVVLTPAMVSADKTRSVDFPSVVINGANRHKAYARALTLTGKPPVEGNIKEVVKKNKKTPKVISYAHSVPFESWMQEAELIIKESVTGCAECGIGNSQLALLKMEKPFTPTYIITYIAPEAEPVKARSDRHSATFNYVVGKHDLHRDYKNNASEFARVDNVINEVKNNQDLHITEFIVSGYASPEGNYNANSALSDRRAHSFADYLSNTHGIHRNQFNVKGYGEDWDGLKQAVEKSSLTERNEILRIISTVSNPDARDAELKKLSKGQIYRTLLGSYYPPLRRTDYTIAYNVRAFSIEEAREIIKTNPKLLSMNEMYLVAQSYPVNSKEFKEVFDIASRLYPDQLIAIINSTATDIEVGNNQAAIDRLSKIENDPRTWNNLGVAYAQMGELNKAKQYFENATAKGDTDAKTNLAELEKARAN